MTEDKINKEGQCSALIGFAFVPVVHTCRFGQVYPQCNPTVTQVCIFNKDRLTMHGFSSGTSPTK